MRIKALRLEWFRGAADPVTLAADSRSMAIYGCNGAGKSSFVDAVEYGIKRGRIGHLVSEYSGRNQENAIPNTHTPADRFPGFSISFQDDSELEVVIAPDGSHVFTVTHLQEWDYRRVVLRQDEVAEFVRSSKGEKYSALLPLFGLHELEVTAENLRQLARSIEQQSRLAQNQGALGEVAKRRRQVFSRDTDDEIASKVADLYQKYNPAGQATPGADRCWEIEATVASRIAALSAENRRFMGLRVVADLDTPSAVKAVRDASAKLADSVEPLVAEKLAVLESAEAFAGKLADTGAVDCPACGQSIAAAAFKAHVRAERVRLVEINAVFKARRSAVSALIDRLKTLKAAVAKAELDEWRKEQQSVLKSSLDWIEHCDAESYRQSLRDDDLDTIARHCPAVVAAARTSCQQAPPDIADLFKDRTTVEAAKSVFESQALAADIDRAERLIAFVRAVEAGMRAEIRERSQAVISEISGDIGDMWKTLHPGEPIDDVRLYLPDDDKAIDVALRFHGKDQDSPRLTLSEGYRNSLGLCIFLALAKREAGNDRPLILDDVVVSLDRHHRGMIVALLESQFADRQVILFTHDREWFAELRHQLDGKRWHFKSLRPYETPLLGIRWSDRTTSFDDARAHLNDRPDSAGNDARKIMDVELALAAEKLQLRLPYLRGERNDHRMWSEFIERLLSDGKRCLQKKNGNDCACYTAGLEVLDQAGRLLVSWGNRASHTRDLERAEATKLIEACEQAVAVFQCDGCKKSLWFANAGGGEWVQCQCGELRWRYGKG